MSANSLAVTPDRVNLIGSNNTNAARVNVALNSAFTLGSAGAAVGARFYAPDNTTIVNVYWFCAANVTGNPGNLTVTASGYGSTSIRPSATPLTNGTTTVSLTSGAINTWKKATFATPPSVTVGNIYWLTIGDPDGDVSNFATISRSGSMVQMGINQAFRTFSSADGFTTDGANTSASVSIVIEFGNGMLLGSSYTTTVSYSNNTRERGIKILGLTVPTIINCAAFQQGGLSQVSGLKIYEGDSTAPGGTIYSGFNGGSAWTAPTGTASALSLMQFPPCTLQANTVYRAVLTYGSNATTPTAFQIEDSASFPAILAASLWNGRIHSTIDNGSGGWTDQTDRIPQFWLGAVDYVAASGGGVGAGRSYPRGVA